MVFGSQLAVILETYRTSLYVETVLHGYPLYRSIQPSAWSRKRGIHGQDPLHLPMYQLLQYGVEAFSLRTLSAGRFVGLVSTRSVAESVFVSQLLRTIREANLYIIPLQNICTGPELLQLPSRQSKKLRLISFLLLLFLLLFC